MIDFDEFRAGHGSLSPSEYDAERSWILDHSLALVVPAPGSIYSARRPDFGPRWDRLVEAMSVALHHRIAADDRLSGLSVVRDHYRTSSASATGGPFGDLTVVFTLAENVNDLVQTASGWIAIAELIRGFYADRQTISFDRHEHDEGNRVSMPMPSMMGVKALCIADMLERFGLHEVPNASIEGRDTNLRHPDFDGRYIFAATVGTAAPQTLVYVVATTGLCLENFAIVDDRVIPLQIPHWLPWHLKLAV